MKTLEPQEEAVVTPEAKVDTPPEVTPEAAASVVDTGESKVQSEPNEALFGGLLLFCLVLSLIAATGYFGLAGYRYFKEHQAERAIPTIESLPLPEVPTKPEGTPVAGTESTPATPTETVAPAVEKGTLSIKVLNGGSAKGVAGTFAEKLKQAGFTKTAVGNAFGDYTGQTLYYAKGQETGSKVIQTEVMKTYPALVVKEAPTSDRDATAATFVLIIGR